MYSNVVSLSKNGLSLPVIDISNKNCVSIVWKDYSSYNCCLMGAFPYGSTICAQYGKIPVAVCGYLSGLVYASGPNIGKVLSNVSGVYHQVGILGIMVSSIGYNNCFSKTVPATIYRCNLSCCVPYFCWRTYTENKNYFPVGIVLGLGDGRFVLDKVAFKPN